MANKYDSCNSSQCVPSTNDITNKIREYDRRHDDDRILIWVIEKTLENANNQKMIAQLRCLVNIVEIFTSLVDSIDYLSKVTKERVIFVISDVYKNDVIRIHQNPQVDSIYIFCTQKHDNEKWMNRLSKVRGVCTRIEELGRHIHQDIRQSQYYLIRLDIVGKFTHEEKQNQQEASFMYIQLLKEILLQFTDGDQYELTEFCRPKYAENLIQFSFIDELERTYALQSPVWWYTRPSFLYNMLNKALRDLDVETLYAFRHFIRHLHEQLTKLHQKSFSTNNMITLYRGQQMQIEQIKEMKLNQDGLLSIANFLSTSIDKEVALMFAGNVHHDDNTVPVLMVIQAQCSPETTNVPFANIDTFSYFAGSEKEYLFSMGSVFRIGEIEKSADEIWFVHLMLTNDQDPQLITLTNHFRNETQDKVCTPLMQLARLTGEMGEWSTAELFCRKALEIESQPSRCAFLLNDLGMCFGNRGQLDEALNYFQQSLLIKQEHISEDNPPLSAMYNNIGAIYRKKNLLDLALEYLQKALNLDVNATEPNQQGIAAGYNNIAGVLIDLGNYEEALKYYRLCLDIDLATLPPTHPRVARTYHNMAIIFDKADNPLEAMQYEQKAIDIVSKSLPQEHPYIKQYKESLQLYQQKIK